VFLAHDLGADFRSPRTERILTVANDFIKRDWSHGYSIWKEVSKGLPCDVIGNTPGLSKAVELEDLVMAFSTYAVYLNTTTEVPVPTSMMEAMACQCPVVALDTGGIREIIEHGINGFLANNVKELKEYCSLLLKDKQKRVVMGYAARKTIKDKYPLQNFINSWNIILNQVANIPYTGDLHAD